MKMFSTKVKRNHKLKKQVLRCDLKVLTDLQLRRCKGSEYNNLTDATVNDLSQVSE